MDHLEQREELDQIGDFVKSRRWTTNYSEKNQQKVKEV